MSMSNHDRRGQTFVVLAQGVISSNRSQERRPWKQSTIISDSASLRILVNRPPHSHEVVFYKTKPPLRLRA